MAITPIRFLDHDGLLNVATSDFLRKDNELSASKNVYCYELGKLEKVPGYLVAGNDTQVINGQSVSQLHYYFRSAISAKSEKLLAFSNSSGNLVLKYIEPTTAAVTDWTTITPVSGYTSMGAAKVCAVNYLDRAFIVGYVSGTTFLPNTTLLGTTLATTDGTNLTNMPQGKFIVQYRDLLYVLNAYESTTLYPNRMYWCADPVNMAITWANTTNYADIGFNNGDEITGAGEVLDRLIVFKRFSMWKWDESEIKEISTTGCDSHDSIKKIGSTLYWFNRTGFYRYTGSDPECISLKVQPFIDAMDQTTLDTVKAEQHEFEYRAFIGTVTVDGVTYTNAWFCFDTRREKCYIRCTAHTAKSTAYFLESGKKRMYFGNDNGYVYKFATKVDGIYRDGQVGTNTTTGSEIDSFFVTGNLDHGVPEDTKFTVLLTAFSRNCQGLKVAVDVDNLGQFSEESKQILKKNVDTLEFGATGNRFRYKFYEKSGDKSWEFEGFVIKTDIQSKIE